MTPKIPFLKETPPKIIISRGILGAVVLIFLTIDIITAINAVKWVNKPFAGFLISKRMNIDYVGLPHWTGVQAGLKFPDKLLKVNNQITTSTRDFYEVVTNTEAGTPIRYSFQRGKKIIEFSVPTMLFTWSDLLLKYGILYLLGNIYLLLGIVVFVLKPDTKVSWIFLLGCFLFGLDYITSFDNTSTHYGFVRVMFFTDTFNAAVILHFSLLFPERLPVVERHPAIQVIPYIIAVTLFTGLEGFYPNNPLFETFFILMNLYLVISAAGFIISIIHSYWKGATMISIARAKVILLGSSLAFPVPAVASFVSSYGGSFGKVPIAFTALPMTIFPVSIAYAIARHNLFDVDVYIKRTVGYVIMTVIVGMAYFAMQTLVGTVILKPVLGDEKAESVYPILFAILVVFFFNPFSRVVQNWVDRLFYRKKFDYKGTITSLSNALTSVLDLDEIIREIIHTVRKEMFIDTAGVILFKPEKKECQTFFIGDESEKITDHTKDICIANDDPLLTLLSNEKGLITKYDVEEDPRYVHVKDTCGQSFSRMGASIAMPFIYKDKVKGVFVLGTKKSGHFYTREDIDLLTTLTSQGAVAIENARLFEENLEKQRMEDELRIAHDIQVSMLPEKSPEIEGFEIEGRCIPAKEVGGDFYDFIEIGNGGGSGKLGIVVGDVTGKGVSGALMMAASRSAYRVLAEQYSSVAELMCAGNRRLNKDIKKGMFVALLYAELNPRERTLILSNAGQTQPILCPADRSTQPNYIDTEGDKFPLGIIKDCTYQETEVRLKSGDVVFFYTDGVVEAMNEKGEMYGFERLMISIDEGRGLGAGAVMDKLINDISIYVGGVEQHDDLTIVVVKAR